jgi:hypothetical protein
MTRAISGGVSSLVITQEHRATLQFKQVLRRGAIPQTPYIS